MLVIIISVFGSIKPSIECTSTSFSLIIALPPGASLEMVLPDIPSVISFSIIFTLPVISDFKPAFRHVLVRIKMNILAILITRIIIKAIFPCLGPRYIYERTTPAINKANPAIPATVIPGIIKNSTSRSSTPKTINRIIIDNDMIKSFQRLSLCQAIYSL